MLVFSLIFAIRQRVPHFDTDNVMNANLSRMCKHILKDECFEVHKGYNKNIKMASASPDINLVGESLVINFLSFLVETAWMFSTSLHMNKMIHWSSTLGWTEKVIQVGGY